MKSINYNILYLEIEIILIIYRSYKIMLFLGTQIHNELFTSHIQNFLPPFLSALTVNMQSKIKKLIS